MEDQAPRLAESQAVAFYRIGVIIRLKPDLLFYPSHDISRQWPQCVQFPFQAINFFKDRRASRSVNAAHDFLIV